MEAWTNRVGLALREVHTRALPLSVLRDRLLKEGVTEARDGRWFLAKLQKDAPGFRVIRDRMGPWLGTHSRTRWMDPGSHGSQKGLPPSDPWVLALTGAPTVGETLRTNRTARELREGLQAWGRELDDGSPASVARWIAAVKEAERVLGTLLSRRESGTGTSPSTSHPPHRSQSNGVRRRWQLPQTPPPVRPGSRSPRARRQVKGSG